NVDMRNRTETFTQNVFVESSTGTNTITVEIKPPELAFREKNRLAAFADRQKVFKGECAKCHLEPALGKSIHVQFDVLCGTCHEAKDRDQAVPALTSSKEQRDKA